MKPSIHFLATAVLSMFCAVSTTRASSVYFVGNSVTDGIRYDGLQAMAESRGKTHSWGRHMIPGAPLEWIWNHPADGFGQDPYGLYPNALPNYAWDFLSLQPFDRILSGTDGDLAMSGSFINLARTKTANAASMTTLVYARYPRQDESNYSPAPRDYNTLWLRSYTGGWDGTNETRDYFNQLTDSLRTTYGSSRVYLVPVGEVFYELNQRMKAGLIPGYTNVFELYKDGIHCSNVGSYTVGLTFFATIYRETPVGLGVPAAYAPDGAVAADRTITPELAAALQSAVWDVARATTRSGVPIDSLFITTTSLAPGRYGEVFSGTVSSLGGTAPVTYSIAGGALAPGLSLAGTGVVSGTPTGTGTFTFRVRAVDNASHSAERDIVQTITTGTNNPPVITTGTTLAAGFRGSRYTATFSAAGGAGTLTWSLVSGTLPTGLSVGGGGALTGIPTAEGTFTFTVKASDSSVPPATDQRTFSLTIGAPESITVFPQKVTSAMNVDGALTETVWTLPCTANASGLGSPNNTVTWQALWDDNYLYVAVKVLDERLVNQSATPSADDDTVEIYLDAYNDKELFYNSQHRQFRVGLNGALQEVVGGRDTGTLRGVALIPGGYTVELAIPWSNLGITGSANVPLGVDIGVNDNDGGATRSAFSRFANASASTPNPSQFGNALLSSGTVSGTGALPSLPPDPAAYEPFDYTNGTYLKDNTLQGGTGWPTGSGNTWGAQDGVTHFTIDASTPLTYTSGGSLVTSGLCLNGSSTWQSAGRYVSMSALANWKISGSNAIGLDGTELWFSYLVRYPTANSTARVLLENDSFPSTDNNTGLRIQQSGGVWQLNLNNGAVVANSSVAATNTTTYLMVLRMRFGAGGANDTIDLFVNPSIGGADPSTPSATLTGNVVFNQVVVNPYGASMLVDELRFGSSFTSVTPTVPEVLTAPQFSTLPGVYASAVSLSLSSTATGATIRYTTDGTAPTAGSAVYSSPLNLAAGTTTTVRAKTFKSGAVEGPEAGGIFVVRSVTQAWLESQGLAYNTDVATDPAGAGVPLLLRHAFGLGAHEPPRNLVATTGTSGLPSACRNASGNLQLEFVRRRDGSRLYTVQRGTTLGSWESVATQSLTAGTYDYTSYTIAVSNIDSSWDRVVFTEKPSADTRRFLRVQVQ